MPQKKLKNRDQKLIAKVFKRDATGVSPLERRMALLLRECTMGEIATLSAHIDAMGMSVWVKGLGGDRFDGICIAIAIDSIIKSGRLTA
jgi:hypothetical protein